MKQQKIGRLAIARQNPVADKSVTYPRHDRDFSKLFGKPKSAGKRGWRADIALDDFQQFHDMGWHKKMQPDKP